MVKSAVPYALDGASGVKLDRAAFRAAFPFIAVAALLMFGGFLWSLPAAERLLYVLLILSWVPWFVFMRRHPAPEVHDYTSIYFAGPLLATYAALFGRIPGAMRSAAVALALAVFIASNAVANAAHAKLASTEAYTADFEHLLTRIAPGEKVYVDGVPADLVPPRPFATGFYLSTETLAPPRASITRSAATAILPLGISRRKTRLCFYFACSRRWNRLADRLRANDRVDKLRAARFMSLAQHRRQTDRNGRRSSPANQAAS